jgi:hypothetical protein
VAADCTELFLRELGPCEWSCGLQPLQVGMRGWAAGASRQRRTRGRTLSGSGGASRPRTAATALGAGVARSCRWRCRPAHTATARTPPWCWRPGAAPRRRGGRRHSARFRNVRCASTSGPLSPVDPSRESMAASNDAGLSRDAEIVTIFVYNFPVSRPAATISPRTASSRQVPSRACSPSCTRSTAAVSSWTRSSWRRC